MKAKNSVLFAVVTALFGVVPAFAVTQSSGPREVLRDCRQDRVQGVQCVVVFDLDETTVDSSPRRVLSLEVARAEICSRPELAHHQGCAGLREVTVEMVREQNNTYDFAELLGALGVTPDAVTAEIEKKMIDVYLSGRFESADVEIPGASAYLNRLADLGAEIHLVSSRFSDTQGASTRASLHSMGFPMGPSTHVELRVRGETSIDFKKRAFAAIRSSVESEGPCQRIRGAFENEPENLAAMDEAFPEARLVFVEGAFIKAGPISARARLIRNYL